MKHCRHTHCCSIMPPYILRKLLTHTDPVVRDAALNTLVSTARMSGERKIRDGFAGIAAAPTDGRRSIFDCKGSSTLDSAMLVRTEMQPASADTTANEAFEGLGFTRDFYRQVLARNSIDARGMRLDGYVHRGHNYNNAFWDGEEMVFGDGDGVLFTRFTRSLDVIAHELTHGVTASTAALEYHLQPGALNESISDVFGSMVKQWHLGQTAEEADWLIGAEVFTPGVAGDALRSLRAPGTAYDNPDFGKDPQPDHISRLVVLPDTEEGDNGGVHTNSGIPNKAFYLCATNIGGHSWEAPGKIWYAALLASNAKTDFQAFADTTFAQAGQLFGAGSAEQRGVQDAWAQVGLRISGPTFARTLLDTPAHDDIAAQIRALAAQIEQLSAQIPA